MKNKFLKIAAAIISSLMITGGGSEKSVAVNSTTDPNLLTVTYFDVGKGDCILLEKDGYTVLIDAGYEETSDDVSSWLKQKNIETLDYFIVTHYDKDHVGGASAIAATFNPEQIYLPDYEGESKYYSSFMETIENKNLNAQNVSEDISFTVSDVTYTIFASDIEYVKEDDEEGNDNDVSLVISAEYNDDSYLFAEDIEKKGIKSYLAKSHGQFDVVKMPHHGVKVKNSDDFIDDTQPKIAVITDSTDKTASNKLLTYLEEAGADIYCTSETGTIIITSEGNGSYSVETEKEPKISEESAE